MLRVEEKDQTYTWIFIKSNRFGLFPIDTILAFWNTFIRFELFCYNTALISQT